MPTQVGDKVSQAPLFSSFPRFFLLTVSYMLFVFLVFLRDSPTGLSVDNVAAGNIKIFRQLV